MECKGNGKETGNYYSLRRMVYLRGVRIGILISRARNEEGYKSGVYISGLSDQNFSSKLLAE